MFALKEEAIVVQTFLHIDGSGEGNSMRHLMKLSCQKVKKKSRQMGQMNP